MNEQTDGWMDGWIAFGENNAGKRASCKLPAGLMATVVGTKLRKQMNRESERRRASSDSGWVLFTGCFTRIYLHNDYINK